MHLDAEILNKHFKDVPASSIPPVKLETAVGIDMNVLNQLVDTFWQYKGQRYFDSYQLGKVIGSSNQNSTTTVTTVLCDFAKIVEEGIKTTNIKAGATNENFKDHFIILLSLMKVIASDLNALYAQQSRDNEQSKKEIDVNDLLAILSGYVTTKNYGK